MESKDMRDLGDLGESVLRQWTAQIGVKTNKSQDKDATGWDFILEWPFHYAQDIKNIPLDRVPTPLKCLVQVKSTDKKITRCQITLANWLYLIRSPYPAFFLVLHFDGKNDCQQAYLIHIGEDYIAKVQKRLRSESPKKRSPKLNRTTMQFSWKKTDLLVSLEGTGLQRAILNYLKNGMDAYIEWKRKLCASVGYEKGEGVLDLTIILPTGVDAEEHVVDFDLGLIEHLKIHSSELIDDRFDIPVTNAQFPSGGLLQVLPSEPTCHGLIAACIPSQGTKLFLDCDAYLPTSFGKFVNQEKLKARFKSLGWDLVIPRTRQATMSLKFNPSELAGEQLLGRLRKSAQLLLMMLDSAKNGEPIALSAIINDEVFGEGRLTVSTPLPPSLIAWAKLMDHAWYAASYFQIHDSLSVKVEDLATQHDALSWIRTLTESDPRAFQLLFWIDSHEALTAQTCCIAHSVLVTIGKYRAELAIGLLGTMRFSGNRSEAATEYKVEVSDICVCHKNVAFAATAKAPTHDELKQFIEQHHPDTRIIIPDYSLHAVGGVKSEPT